MNDQLLDIQGRVKQDHRYNGTLNLETPEEAEFRRNQEALKAGFEQKKENREHIVKTASFCIIFLFVVLMAAAVAYECSAILTTPGSSSDDKKWASTLFGSMLSGVFGYLLGTFKKS